VEHFKEAALRLRRMNNFGGVGASPITEHTSLIAEAISLVSGVGDYRTRVAEISHCGCSTTRGEIPSLSQNGIGFINLSRGRLLEESSGKGECACSCHTETVLKTRFYRFRAISPILIPKWTSEME